jgi:lambda family phage tail tape measure protein
MEQIEPLILRFDVDDKGGVKVERIGDKVEDLGKKLKDTEGKGKGLSSSFGGLGAVLTKIPGPMGLVSGAANFMATSFRRVQSAIFSLKSLFIGMGVAFTAFSFISAASQVEQYRLRLRQLTGDVEEGNRIFEDAAKYASQVSFAYREVLDSAVKLRSTIAGTPEEVAALSRLSGDIASTFGMSLEDTTTQLVRALSAGIGSADLWRERGVTAALGFQQGVSYTTEETVQIIADAWLKADSKIRGASANLVDTFSGQMSMLGDKWFQFRTMVMEAGLFDMVKDGLKGLNAVLESLMNENKDLIEGAVASFSEGVRTAATVAGPLILRIGTFIPLIWALGKDAVEGIRLGIVGIGYAGTWAAEMITSATQKVWELIQTIIGAVRAFFGELASQTSGVWGLGYISNSAAAMEEALKIPNDIATLGAETSKANAEAAKSWKDYFSATFDSILGNFEERGALVRELRKGRGEDVGSVVGASNIGLALEERGGLMKALFGQSDTVDRLMEAFNRGVAGGGAVEDTAAARERDAEILRGLVQAQNDTADALLAEANARADAIHGLVQELQSGIEQMGRQQLARTSGGLKQLFEEDMAALRRSMEELGIYQDFEADFLEYRRLAWEQTSEAIIAAQRREEAERERQLALSDNYFAGLKGGLDSWVEAAGSGYQQAARFAEDALSATRNAMADFVVSVANDTSNIKDHFRNMANALLQSLQRIAAQALVTALILAILPGGAAAGGAGTLLGGLIGGKGSGSTGNYGFISGEQSYHTGGLVGRSSTGPSPDEVSAVLQRGEYVVSRRGVDALDRLNAGDAGPMAGRASERQVDRAVIIAEEDLLTFAERSGRFRQTVVQIAREDGGFS